LENYAPSELRRHVTGILDYDNAFNAFCALEDFAQSLFITTATDQINGETVNVQYTLERLKNMTVVELKSICRVRGLKVSGNKDELIARILE
jgi:hypothetical protein